LGGGGKNKLSKTTKIHKSVKLLTSMCAHSLQNVSCLPKLYQKNILFFTIPHISEGVSILNFLAPPNDTAGFHDTKHNSFKPRT